MLDKTRWGEETESEPCLKTPYCFLPIWTIPASSDVTRLTLLLLSARVLSQLCSYVCEMSAIGNRKGMGFCSGGGPQIS